MKYGVCLWMLPLSLKEAIPFLHNLGYNCCAIGADALKGEQLDEIKKLLSENQMEVASIGVNELCNVGMSKQKNEKKAIEILQEALDIALYLKSPVLQIPSFADGSIHTQDELEQTAKCLHEICDKARPYDIKIGHESVLTVEQNRYVEEKAGENLFLYYDATNIIDSKTEDPIRLMEQLYHKICQVHVKDGICGNENFVPIGLGDRRVKEICEKLVAFGYDGAILLESNYGLCKDLKADLKNELALLKGYMEI